MELKMNRNKEHNQKVFLEYAIKSWKPILENEEMSRIVNFLIDDKKTLIFLNLIILILYFFIFFKYS